MQFESILKQYWGHASLRPAQQEAIESVLAGRDTLTLLPTAGGKSLCFQLPTLTFRGTLFGRFAADKFNRRPS